MKLASEVGGLSRLMRGQKADTVTISIDIGANCAREVTMAFTGHATCVYRSMSASN